MPQTIKKERLETRLTPDQKEVIERAASLEGRSVSDFVTVAAVKAARLSIETHEKMRLSAKDSTAFAKALINPPEPNAALIDAAKAHRKLINAGK